jgi:hypothetical protein
VRLGRAIERDLVAAVTGPLARYVDRQLPAGRPGIIGEGAAEVEVRFKILEARDLSGTHVDAFLVLREYRVDELPNRPTMYWYGLSERLESGEWLYETFHLHDEPGDDVGAHFQVEIRATDTRLRSYERTGLASGPHVVPAVEKLMARYYARLAASEPSAGAG